jgi:CMP-N-acetylneuraminic acid synthetase
MPDITCIIPARGGSKRLPRKNIALLNGEPLIAYSIKIWPQSKYYDGRAPIVTTEDLEIGEISWKYGAQWLVRPIELAQGNFREPTPIIKDVIDVLFVTGRKVQYILYLQPTSPLRRVEDIDTCLAVVTSNVGWDSATSIIANTDLENGAVYVTHADIINSGHFYGKKVFRYPMPNAVSVDIDEAKDLAEAEQYLRLRGMK